MFDTWLSQLLRGGPTQSAEVAAVALISNRVLRGIGQAVARAAAKRAAFGVVQNSDPSLAAWAGKPHALSTLHAD